MHPGSFKASARRARRATATGTVSPLTTCERESKIKQNRFQRFGLRRRLILDKRHRDARRSARRRFVSLVLPPPLAENSMSPLTTRVYLHATYTTCPHMLFVCLPPTCHFVLRCRAIQKPIIPAKQHNNNVRIL